MPRCARTRRVTRAAVPRRSRGRVAEVREARRVASPAAADGGAETPLSPAHGDTSRDRRGPKPLVERNADGSSIRSSVPLELLDGREQVRVVPADPDDRQPSLAAEAVDLGLRNLPAGGELGGGHE